MILVVLCRCTGLLVFDVYDWVFRADDGNRNAVENVRSRHIDEALFRDGQEFIQNRVGCCVLQDNEHLYLTRLGIERRVGIEHFGGFVHRVVDGRDRNFEFCRGDALASAHFD